MLHTIKSKLLLAFGLALILQLGLAILTITSNQKTAETTERFLDRRMLLAIYPLDILSSANQAASLQRLYALTLKESVIEQRNMVWQNQIYPLLTKLQEIKPRMYVQANKDRIDSLTIILPRFDMAQQEITEIVKSGIADGKLAEDKKEKALGVMTGKALQNYTAIQRLAKDLANSQLELVKTELNESLINLNSVNRGSIFGFSLTAIIFMILAYLIVKDLDESVSKVRNQVSEVVKGKIVNKQTPPTNELGIVVEAANILVDKFALESKFATAIGRGEFGAKLDVGAEDVMGNALLEMRDNLLRLTQENVNALHEAQAQEEELKQQNEEMVTIQDDLARKSKQIEKANHDLENKIAERTKDLQVSLDAAEKQKNDLQIAEEKLRIKQAEMEETQVIESQLSKLDDLMRLNYDKSIDEFTDIILHNICKVTLSMRGVMFILSDQTLKAVGGYACTPQTLAKNEFQLGENLLGQAAKTKEFILLENLPSTSTRVASALSQIENGNVIIIPLVYNEKVQGVIELTSLKPYDVQRIEFVKRACKNVGAMLQNIFSNMRTQRLLEESQDISVRLQVQEEEARQTVEELRSTQEEIQRKQSHTNALWSAVSSASSFIELDLNGVVLSANAIFLHLTNYELDEVIGKPHSLFVDPEYAVSKEYAHFWSELRKGKAQSGEFKRHGKNGKEFWLLAHYTPVLNQDGLVIKIIKLATDITEQKKLSVELNEKMVALDRSNAVIEFDTHGIILDANQNLLDMLGYELKDIKGKHHKIFVSAEEQNTAQYKQFWQKLAEGEYISGNFKRINKLGKEIVIKGNYNPILNTEGQPYKVVEFMVLLN